MRYDNIGDWSQADLRRFIVNLLLSDPGALPREVSGPSQQLPSGASDGEVPIWDSASNSWKTTGTKKEGYSQLNLANSIVSGDIVDGTIVDADINAAAAIEGSKFNWHVGSSPPGSPGDGMLWIYNGTAGIYWMFVYDSSETTYKWKFVGGAPMRSGVGTDETFTDDSTYHDAATAGPTITAPRAGDYYYLASADMYVAAQPAGTDLGIGFKVTISNGSLEVNDSSISQQLENGGVGVQNFSQVVHTAQVASGTAKMQYVCSASTGTAHTRWRAMSAWPIRVI